MRASSFHVPSLFYSLPPPLFFPRYFHAIIPRRGLFSPRACFIVKSNDHGITEAISNTIRDIMYVYIITPTYLRAISTRLHPEREKRKEDLPAFPPPPLSVHVPLSDRIAVGLSGRSRWGFAILRVFTYSCRCIRELFPRGYSSRGKEEGGISAERDYEIIRQSVCAF